jgi:hypothetical protein
VRPTAAKVMKPKRLLEWHREKAGTIEAVHDVLKNELAGGILPCGRYGANAAWFRLAVITYNVLTAMKRLVLPAEMQTARPKLFNGRAKSSTGLKPWRGLGQAGESAMPVNARSAFRLLPLEVPLRQTAQVSAC